MPRHVQPYMDLESFYVLISRSTSLKGVRLLSYHKEAVEELASLKHTVELKAWNAGYATVGTPPRPHGRWCEDLAVDAASHARDAAKAAKVDEAVARKAAAEIALKTAPRELRTLTVGQLWSRCQTAGAMLKGTYLKGELVKMLLERGGATLEGQYLSPQQSPGPRRRRSTRGCPIAALRRLASPAWI